MRRLMLPLGCYLAVTLAMPLLDGNAGRAFVEHAILVLLGSAIAIVPWPWLMRARARGR
jgi:hypothetical protein